MLQRHLAPHTPHAPPSAPSAPTSWTASTPPTSSLQAAVSCRSRHPQITALQAQPRAGPLWPLPKQLRLISRGLSIGCRSRWITPTKRLSGLRELQHPHLILPLRQRLASRSVSEPHWVVTIIIFETCYQNGRGRLCKLYSRVFCKVIRADRLAPARCRLL